MRIYQSFGTALSLALGVRNVFAANETSGGSRFVDNNGVRIHYKSFQVPAYADKYHVITPTLRGYPPSSVLPDKSNYTSDGFVSDLAAVLRQEGINKTIVVGHDVGGAVAQYFAHAYPEMVKALVLTNTAFLPRFIPLIENDAEQQQLALYTIPCFAYQPGQPKNISTIVRDFGNETYQHEIAQYLSESPIEGMLSFYSLDYPAPPYGRNVSLAGLVQAVPACIIWGELDRAFSSKMVVGLFGWVASGVRLVSIANAGHWASRDEPARWNAELTSFLDLVDAYKFVTP